MGDFKAVDMMVHDGLTDVFNKYHMGITAENIVDQWKLTREQLDEFSANSQKKAVDAIKSGAFKDEIVPVNIPQRKGDPIVFDTDEFPREGVTAESLGKLKPAFKKEGAVTAGNASGINDSAAAVAPEIMGIGPVPSTKKALEKAGMSIDDMDLIEANEAFAAQSVAVGNDLGIDTSKLNVNGGAIALGHPIGASGCRILVTLLYAMKSRDAHKGLATLCIGGGQGTALIVER